LASEKLAQTIEIRRRPTVIIVKRYGRRRHTSPRCRHLAYSTKHMRGLWFWPIHSIMWHTQSRKYATYCIAVREEPGHSHR